MVSSDAGIDVTLSVEDVEGALFHEQPGRALIQTTDPDAVREAFDGVAPVREIGTGTDDGRLSLAIEDGTLEFAADEIADLRSTIDRGMD
jgi:phosphoribosylformylglycinamidine synthase